MGGNVGGKWGVQGVGILCDTVSWTTERQIEKNDRFE